MSEFKDIQRLISLKKYETPGKDFVEDFLAQFHERQRSEMLRQSSLNLVWDRMAAYFYDLVTPKWVLATATASVALLVAWISLSPAKPAVDSTALVLVAAQTMPVTMQVQPALAVDSQLIREVEHDRKLEIDGILLSRHFESDEIMPSDSTEVVSLSGAAVPVSAELLPVSAFNR